MAVHLAGGRPVFAELDPATLALDPAAVARAATPRTKGVILVHFAGLLTPAVEPLRDWCRAKGLFLIEDCAHAVGARWKGIAAGAWGEIGCYSLFPTKVITAGEGGVAVTKDERLAKVLRSLQHRGRDLDAPEERYARPGRNIRMTELAALLGRVQLARLPGWLEARRRVAAAYDSVLAGTDARPVAPPEPGASAYWKYAFLVPAGADRDGLMAALREAGLLADPGYRPLVHLQPVFRTLYGHREGLLPVTEAAAARLVCLPCHPRVDAARAAAVLRGALAGLRRAA
jgi:dTDP-4-amino-4,6-dideoxygalactose transaminase